MLSPDDNKALGVWIAVLLQATADLAMQEYRLAAQLWFTSTEQSLGSFCWICTLLNRDPDKMRAELEQLSTNPNLLILLERYSVNRNREAVRRLAGRETR